jgi:hypothetical protein
LKRNEGTPRYEESAAIETALDQSLSELRPLIEILYANEQQAEELLLSQVKALFLKQEHGIAAARSDFISVLQAAERLQGRTER